MIDYFNLGSVSLSVYEKLVLNVESFFRNSLIKWYPETEVIEVINGKTLLNDELKNILSNYSYIFSEEKILSTSTFYYNSPYIDTFLLIIEESDLINNTRNGKEYKCTKNFSTGVINSLIYPGIHKFGSKYILLDHMLNVLNREIPTAEFIKEGNDLMLIVNDEAFKIGGFSRNLVKDRNGQIFYVGYGNINWEFRHEIADLFKKLTVADKNKHFKSSNYKPIDQLISSISTVLPKYQELRNNFSQLLADEIGIALVNKESLIYLENMGCD